MNVEAVDLAAAIGAETGEPPAALCDLGEEESPPPLSMAKT
jgi:hypothetical protein